MATSGTITQQLQRAVLLFAQQAHDEAVRQIMDELAVAAPLGETGETRRQLRAVPQSSGTTMSTRVESPTPQGEYVEEGTPAHEISGNPVLRFLWSKGRISVASPNQRTPTTRGAGVVFFTHVMHPEVPPRPWFDPVVQTYSDRLQTAADGITVAV